MEVAVLVHREQISETAFRRFEHSVFDGVELAVDELRVLTSATES